MSFKVIDGGGPPKEDVDRKRIQGYAEDELRYAAREAAANVIRIVRGAGKSYLLIKQFAATVKAAAKLQEITGVWPDHIIANELRLKDAHQAAMEDVAAGRLDRARYEDWSESGEYDRSDAIETIVRGSLQIAASQLVDQRTQENAGESELYRGIRNLEKAREVVRRYGSTPRKVGKATGVMTVNLAPTIRREAEPRSAKFDAAAMKALRRAIKDKDDAKIKELIKRIKSPFSL